MNEQTLSYLYEKLKYKERNNYPSNISLDLLEIAEQELDRIGVRYNKVRENKKLRLYLYDKGHKIYRYTRSFYPNNTMFGFKISNDKMLTEKYLQFSNIKTTKSKIYSLNEFQEAKKYVNDSNNKLVLKPSSLSGGAGVFIDVNGQNFDYFWKECVLAQKNRKVESPKVIIQNLVKGFEVRLVYTEGVFLSATIRIPAHVKGNGTYSIKELIERKNKKRQSNPFLATQPIKITNRLKELLNHKNLSLESIIEKDRFCILYPQSNTQLGGENIEITNLISKKIIQQGLESVIAIPGIHTAGVDIMLEDLEADQGTILEINKAPAFLINYYPYMGEPQNPLENIFRNFFVGNKIFREDFDIDELSNNEIEILAEKFKFNFLKQKSLEETISKLEEENINLKRQLNKS